MQSDPELLAFFKALADASRLRIVGLLARKPHTVEELAALLGLRASTVSHHLARLVAVDLVSARADGHYHVYSLDTDALAAKAPGGSTEVRIPPYAVVQCVEGPRHTRGTPPNVVETDPLTWIRLAGGRTAWQDAVAEAKVSASGERADLGPHLPLLG